MVDAVVSNYPPGVSGVEPHITGTTTKDATRRVPECDKFDPAPNGYVGARFDTGCTFGGGVVDGELTGGGVFTFWWDCPVCGHENAVVDLTEEDL